MTIPAFITLLAQATPVPQATAAANQAAAPAPSLMSTLIPFILIAFIFYFLIIRPQQKRLKEHQSLISSVKTGDAVVTSGGIHGIVANVKEGTFLLKVADNVKIEVDKSAVSKVEKAANS